MTSTITGPLVTVDDAYDRDRASDGTSRYGAYLRRYASVLHEDGEAVHLTSFAAQCWHIATSPIMDPGYARVRSDIETVTVTTQDDGDGIIATVAVRVHWPVEYRHADALRHWRGWTRRTSWSGTWFEEPTPDTRPALLHTAQLRVPIGCAELPPRTVLTPWRTRAGVNPGEVEIEDAKDVVRAICEAVNATAGPIVDLLREGRRP